MFGWVQAGKTKAITMQNKQFKNTTTPINKTSMPVFGSVGGLKFEFVMN